MMAKARNDELRERIVDTACSMFLEQGYDSVLLKDIASACDISPSQLQYYYAKRSDIVVGIFRTIIDQINNHVRHNFLPAEGSDPIDMEPVYIAAFYRIFYRVLHEANDRLLPLYSIILNDAELLKSSIDLLRRSSALSFWPGASEKTQLGVYAINGTLSQLVAVYRSNPFDGDLERYVDYAIEVFFEFAEIKPARRKAIWGQVEEILCDPRSVALLEGYAAHFAKA